MSSSSSGGQPYRIPRCDCPCCDCYDAQEGDKASSADGAVDPATGTALLDNAAHSTVKSPFGNGLVNELNYGATALDSGFTHVGNFGAGWMSHDLARLQIGTDAVTFPLGPNQVEVYDKVGSAFQAQYFNKSALEQSGSNYVLTSPTGSRKEFDSTGRLTAMVDAGGKRFEVDYVSASKIIIAQTDSSDDVEYIYTLSSGHLQSIIYKVNGGFVRKTEYNYYDTTPKTLKLVVMKQNSTLGGSTEDWQEVDMTFYTYHSGTALLKHVITPNGCKQMDGAGININSATETEYNTYADRKYVEYDTDNRVEKIDTRGGLYSWEFEYHASTNSGGSFNVWTSRTTVKQMSGTTVLRAEIYYFNAVGEMMLKRVTDGLTTPVNEWNVVYQQFEEDTGRMLLSADASAIASVSESNPNLVALQSATGLVRIRHYDANANLEYVGVKEGNPSGEPNKLFARTYEAHTISGVTIYKVKTEKVFPVSGNTSVVALTEYVYTYYIGKMQLQKIVTKPPIVDAAANGDGIQATTEVHFDEWGFVTRTVNELGTITDYVPNRMLGVATQMTQDVGGLGLVTDYTPDLLGRIVLEKGPDHFIDISGTSTNIRSAKWTYYRDAADEIITFGGYVKVSDNSVHAVGPIHIHRTYEEPDETGKSGWLMESFIDAAYTGSSIPAENATYSRTSWVRWKAELFNEAGQRKLSRLYWSIPLDTDTDTGTKNTDYGETAYVYDTIGRLDEVTTPGDTIQKTVFNLMNWAVEKKVGTSSGNLLTVSVSEHNASGDQTKTTIKVNSTSGDDRITDLRYDYRHRLHESETTVEKDSETVGSWTLLVKNTYDNRSNILAVENFHTSTSSTNRTSYVVSSFDARNRPFRSTTYAVNSSGAAGASIVDNTFYDAASNVLRREAAGSQSFTVTDYDDLSRPVRVYTGYDPAGGSSSSSSSGIPDPSDIAGSIIVEQEETVYDDASNAIKQIRKQRFDNATGFGELKDPGTQPKARVYYSASYPDPIGRDQARVDAGTNEGTAWTRPDAIPSRSNVELLISSNIYDAAGNLVQEQDPEGICTCSTFDNAVRLVKVVENCLCEGSSSSSGTAGGTRTTRYEYNSDSLVKKLKCQNPSTGEQVTEWVYGVTTTQGSAINSNLLVFRKIYPDTASGSSSSSGVWNVNYVDYIYNRAGEVTKVTDQAGTVHTYTFDKLGRITVDQVTLPSGSEIDDSVNRIENAYNERLLLTRVSSMKKVTSPPSTTKVNEVKFVFDDFDQPVTEYQEHSGAVNTSTSRKVLYSYGSGSSNSVASNSIRRFSLTMPSGNVLSYRYSAESADKLSRPDTLWLGSSDVQTTYKYLGLSNFVGVNYSVPNVGLTYANGPDNEAGDQYKGLDRFGRPVDLRWVKPTDNYKVQAQYGYDRASHITWRRDKQAHDDSITTEDQMFWYDDLYQVVDRRRGTLAGTYPNYTGISSQVFSEAFSYDETGNWLGYDTTGGVSLSQDRTHNKTNEIATITNPSTVILPLYDPAGNMIRTSQPGSWTAYYTLTWDAWNRPVEVAAAAGTVATYGYDGLFRRTTKSISSEVTHFYYTNQWQICETYLNSGASPNERLFWGLRSTNDLIRRQRDSVPGSSSSSSSGLEEDLYTLTDTMNVVAVCDNSGAVQNRFAYYTFGVTRFLANNWDASTNTNDWTILFHSHWRDLETGLSQMRLRSYHPLLGRWISRDPIEEDGGLNLYVMVENDPVNWVDLLGLARIFTDQTNNKTYWIPTDCCCEEVESWDSGSGVWSNALPGAGGPFCMRDSDVEATTKDRGPGGQKRRHLYGPRFMITFWNGGPLSVHRAQWIHGGGGKLSYRQSQKVRQGITRTMGCTRMENLDIDQLVDRVRAEKRRNPGVPIPAERRPVPKGQKPEEVELCEKEYNSDCCKLKRALDCCPKKEFIM